MSISRPDLLWINHKKPSKREKAYPYVLGFAIAVIIILKATKECM